jgi:hypothetical protein
MPSRMIFNPSRPNMWLSLTLLASLAVSLSGCGTASDPRIAAERKRLVLVDEPADPTSILAAKKQLASPGEVTLVGAIGAGDDDPFEKGEASFVLTELPDHEHGAGHDPGDCPFCKHRAAETPTVIVQLVDAAGKVLTVDAPTLLGLKKGQVVVVRGQGEMNDTLDLLIVRANGIHIRK